jgi:hypothetical protein
MNYLAANDLFFQELRKYDHDLFLKIKAEGCLLCKAKLDTSNYKRKLRGHDVTEEVRYSLCCRREGCRKRVITPSLRFFGRKVYSAWVFILALDYIKELGLYGEISFQTLSRWRNFWRDRLSEKNPFMLKARSFFSPGQPGCDRPGGLLSAFNFPDKNSWIPILKFFII